MVQFMVGRPRRVGRAEDPQAAPWQLLPEFLRSLMRRGRRGVKLVISDSHEGIRAAIAKVLNAICVRVL